MLVERLVQVSNEPSVSLFEALTEGDPDRTLLVVHGEQDMSFLAALVEPTAELIPTARGVVLPQAGHMARIDQPDAWLATICMLLAEVPCH